VAVEALKVIKEERLAENAFARGQELRAGLASLQSPLITTSTLIGHPSTNQGIVRGKGLLNALVMDESKMKPGKNSWELCLELRDLGLVTKPTHGNIIRLIPPLCINKEQIDETIEIFEKALKKVAA